MFVTMYSVLDVWVEYVIFFSFFIINKNERNCFINQNMLLNVITWILIICLFLLFLSYEESVFNGIFIVISLKFGKLYLISR